MALARAEQSSAQRFEGLHAQRALATPEKNLGPSREVADIMALVQKETGIVMKPDRVLTAFNPDFLASLNCKSLSDLVTATRTRGAQVIPRIIDKATINESFFFRDNLKTYWTQFILPHLQELRKKRVGSPKVHLWSAAASTGQEAYSVSMLAQESGIPANEIAILGTDISEQALNQAVIGKYTEFQAARGLDGQGRFFESEIGVSESKKYRIPDVVRQSVKFQKKNLLDVSPMAFPYKMDVVFLRRVIIYFDKTTSEKVINNVFANVQMGGLFIVGPAEVIRINEVLGSRVQQLGPGVFKKIA